MKKMSSQAIHNDRRELFAKVNRLVIKVGSGVLTNRAGLDHHQVRVLADQISRLVESGRQVVLVSSGAIASGRAALGLSASRLRSVPQKQAAAALGQSGLIQAYEEAFAPHGRKVAQVLLTASDLEDRRRYNNIHNTFTTLLEWGVVPVVNENDTVAVEEIKLGDNDNLAAMLTALLQADLMINLTNVDGLLDDDPRNNPQAQRIPVVDKVEPALIRAASSQPGAVGRGGVLSKVLAAEKTACAGIPALVANGLIDDVLDRLFAGQDLGTLFTTHGQRLTGRKHWIAFTAASHGLVVIDEGAVRPIVEKGKSLLAAGIREVRGPFEAGDAIRVLGPGELVLGVGLTNYSSAELEKIKGLRSDYFEQILGRKDSDEVIHRDNFAVFSLDEEESLACLLNK
jgi:glutamate 5-kinase